MKYRIFNIDWDTDELVLDLPNEVFVEVDDIDDVVDLLSDEYGFCVNGYLSEIIEK